MAQLQNEILHQLTTIQSTLLNRDQQLHSAQKIIVDNRNAIIALRDELASLLQTQGSHSTGVVPNDAHDEDNSTIIQLQSQVNEQASRIDAFDRMIGRVLTHLNLDP